MTTYFANGTASWRGKTFMGSYTEEEPFELVFTWPDIKTEDHLREAKRQICFRLTENSCTTAKRVCNRITLNTLSRLS